MIGSSFLAAVQYAAAASSAPAELKTIVPGMIATDIRRVMYQDAFFRHEDDTFRGQSNGFRYGTPVRSMSRTLRVTRVNPYSAAVAAIKPSITEMGSGTF